MIQVDCLEAYSILHKLHGRMPVRFIKNEDGCFIDKYVDVKCSSVSNWLKYAWFVRDVCENPDKYLFNVVNGGMKVPKKMRRIKKILDCRGYEINDLGTSIYVNVSPEEFCKRERIFLALLNT